MPLTHTVLSLARRRDLARSRIISTVISREFALVAAAALVLAASSAQALPSISIIWRDTGTATIGTPTVSASSIVIADVVIHSDANFTNGVFISIEFDVTELQAIGAAELASVNLPGMNNFYVPVVPGVTLVDNTNGIIEGFDQHTLGTGLGVASVFKTLGSVRFHVVTVLGDPPEDVIASLQGALDAIFFSTGPGSANFVGAFLPEPTTAILLIGGIAGLGYASRRSLR